MGAYKAKRYDPQYWGWIWQKKGHRRKKLVSNCPKFDVHQFVKSYKAAFPIVCMMKVSDEISVQAKASTDEIEFSWDKYRYSRAIETEKCHFGGERYYMRCQCGRRYKILYFIAGFLLCRSCSNLKYYSQRLTPNDRFLYMKNKVEDQFKKRKGGWDGYRRPRYMHENTYSRLHSRAWDYEEKAIHYLDKIFGPWMFE